MTRKKTTNWDRYYAGQMSDPRIHQLVEEELRALRVGVELARLRREAGLTQTQLAAKVGMSAPNISRIESSPAQNVTLQTLVKLFGSLGCDVAIVPRKRRQVGARRSPGRKAKG